jgi:flagellar biosynthetic protein FliQ
MDLAQLGAWMLEALQLALLLSAPVLAVSFVVGAAMGTLQSATQIQDPALATVPRIAAVLGTLAFAGAWIGSTLIEFTTRLWSTLGSIS